MKTKIILISLLLSTFMTAQEKLKIHSITTGFGGFYIHERDIYSETKTTTGTVIGITRGTEEIGGATFIINAIFKYNKNLFNTQYISGSEIVFFGDNAEVKIREFSLQYGKEYKPFKWLHLQGFAGLGLYKQISNYPIKNIDTQISLPLTGTIKFNTSRYFGIGLNSNYSINATNNVLGFNLTFSYTINQ